jgi:hypothetical protein
MRSGGDANAERSRLRTDDRGQADYDMEAFVYPGGVFAPGSRQEMGTGSEPQCEYVTKQPRCLPPFPPAVPTMA